MPGLRWAVRIGIVMYDRSNRLPCQSTWFGRDFLEARGKPPRLWKPPAWRRGVVLAPPTVTPHASRRPIRNMPESRRHDALETRSQKFMHIRGGLAAPLLANGATATGRGANPWQDISTSKELRAGVRGRGICWQAADDTRRLTPSTTCLGRSATRRQQSRGIPIEFEPWR